MYWVLSSGVLSATLYKLNILDSRVQYSNRTLNDELLTVLLLICQIILCLALGLAAIVSAMVSFGNVCLWRSEVGLRLRIHIHPSILEICITHCTILKMSAFFTIVNKPLTHITSYNSTFAPKTDRISTNDLHVQSGNKINREDGWTGIRFHSNDNQC